MFYMYFCFTKSVASIDTMFILRELLSMKDETLDVSFDKSLYWSFHLNTCIYNSWDHVMATTFILWPQILFRGNEPEAAPCISTTFINTVIAIIIYKTVAKTRQTKFKILIFC